MTLAQLIRHAAKLANRPRTRPHGAKLAVTEAILFFHSGEFQAAYMRAKRSLLYSVGQHSADYTLAIYDCTFKGE